MGTVVRRGTKWRAVIRHVGFPTQTKSFDTKREADAWERETENAMTHRKVFAGGMTLGQVLIKYRQDTVLNREDTGGEPCLVWLAAKYMEVEFSQMTGAWWVHAVSTIGSYGRRVKPYSAKRYIAAICSALRSAETDYGITVDWNAFKEGMASAKKKKLIGSGKARKRIFVGDEYERVLTAPIKTRLPIQDIINFAIDSCMRIGEICRITWADYDKTRKMQTIRKRKHPTQKSLNDQTIPLLGRCADIINRQPRTDARIFPYCPIKVAHQFKRRCKAMGVDDFTFHDLRHVGITALFSLGYSIQDVAMVSGHSDWAQLKDYVVDKPEDLHAGPDRHRIKAAA